MINQDNAIEYRIKLESEIIAAQPEESPATTLAKSVGLLTPPASNRKSLDVVTVTKTSYNSKT